MFLFVVVCAGNEFGLGCWLMGFVFGVSSRDDCNYIARFLCT